MKKTIEFIVVGIIEAMLLASVYMCFKMCFFDWKGNFVIDDPVVVIVGIVLILLIIFLMWWLAESYIKGMKFDAFFKKNKTSTGKVIKYIYKAEDHHISTMVTRVGTSTIPIITSHTDPEAFLVKLECRTPEGLTYMAEYAISEEDYKKNKPGDLITIKDAWEPWSYEII